MADAEPQIHVANAEAAPARPSLRRRLLTGIAGAVLIAGLGYGGWYVLVGSHYISTDNAYVGADTASVTPMVAAQVAGVAVSDTQAVKKGDILVQLDDSDARIALA